MGKSIVRTVLNVGSCLEDLDHANFTLSFHFTRLLYIPFSFNSLRGGGCFGDEFCSMRGLVLRETE